MKSYNTLLISSTIEERPRGLTPQSKRKDDSMTSQEGEQVGRWERVSRKHRDPQSFWEMSYWHMEISTVTLRFILKHTVHHKPKVLLNNSQGKLPEVLRIWWPYFLNQKLETGLPKNVLFLICEYICTEKDIRENIGNWSCFRNSEICDHHTQGSSDLVFLHRLYMLSWVERVWSK